MSFVFGKLQAAGWLLMSRASNTPELLCSLSRLCCVRVPVTYGFAASHGASAFERIGDRLSMFTQALVRNLDLYGHELDVVHLLDHVSYDVRMASSAAKAHQAPCCYVDRTHQVVLVSVVGSSMLGHGGPCTKSVVLQLVDSFEKQVRHVFCQPAGVC